MKKTLLLLSLIVLTACSKESSSTPIENGDFRVVITKGANIDDVSVLAVFTSDTNAKIIINGETQTSFTEGIRLNQVDGSTITGETDVETRTITLGLNVNADGDFQTAALNIKFFFNNELKHERELSIENNSNIADYIYSLDVQNNLELVEN